MFSEPRSDNPRSKSYFKNINLDSEFFHAKSLADIEKCEEIKRNSSQYVNYEIPGIEKSNVPQYSIEANDAEDLKKKVYDKIFVKLFSDAKYIPYEILDIEGFIEWFITAAFKGYYPLTMANLYMDDSTGKFYLYYNTIDKETYENEYDADYANSF